MTKEDRAWPTYLFGGRMRTSTVALIVAFLLTWWLYQEFKPPPQPVQAPATEVVPPGFVPDPNFTWVPRTDVREQRTTTTPTITTTPTTTETTTPSETTSPTSTTTTSSPTTTPAPPGAPPSTPTSAVPGPGPSPSPSR